MSLLGNVPQHLSINKVIIQGSKIGLQAVHHRLADPMSLMIMFSRRPFSILVVVKCREEDSEVFISGLSWMAIRRTLSIPEFGEIETLQTLLGLNQPKL